MGKTIADELMERGKQEGIREGIQEGIQEGKREGIREGIREGKREGRRTAEISARQHTLIRLLEKRFGEIPDSISSIVSDTDDVQRLDGWLDQIVTVARLSDFDFDS